MEKDPFKEYIRQTEPGKRDKGYAWHTAIGLQAVDGLKTSQYLFDTAIKNIEGDISIDEALELLNSYYEENPQTDTKDRTEMFNMQSKANIQSEKADIDYIKANIQAKIVNIEGLTANKTIVHVMSIYDECGNNGIFGRGIVERITGLKSTRASELLKLLLDNDIIVPAQGHGKGKYRFGNCE